MIKSREKHAGYEVKDLSFWRLNYNSEEIEPKFGEMIVQKLGQFYKLEPHGVKNLNDKVLLWR